MPIDRWPNGFPDHRIIFLLGIDLMKSSHNLNQKLKRDMINFCQGREELKWPEPQINYVMNDMILYWSKEDSEEIDE